MPAYVYTHRNVCVSLLFRYILGGSTMRRPLIREANRLQSKIYSVQVTLVKHVVTLNLNNKNGITIFFTVL